MEEELINKAITNNLIVEIKTKKFDALERAELFTVLLKKHSAVEVAEMVGITRQEVYKYASITKANDNTKKLLKDGLISGDMVSRVTYQLKDKSREDELINKAINENLDRRSLEKEIAQINDPDKVILHICKDIESFNNNLTTYYCKFSEMKPNDRRKLRLKISQSIKQLQEIKEKLK